MSKKTDCRFNRISLILTLPALLLFSRRRRSCKIAGNWPWPRLHDDRSSLCTCAGVGTCPTVELPRLYFYYSVSVFEYYCVRFDGGTHPMGTRARARCVRVSRGHGKAVINGPTGLFENGQVAQDSRMCLTILPVFLRRSKTPPVSSENRLVPVGMMPDVCVVPFVDAAPRQHSPA